MSVVSHVANLSWGRTCCCLRFGNFKERYRVQCGVCFEVDMPRQQCCFSELNQFFGLINIPILEELLLLESSLTAKLLLAFAEPVSWSRRSIGFTGFSYDLYLQQDSSALQHESLEKWSTRSVRQIDKHPMQYMQVAIVAPPLPPCRAGHAAIALEMPTASCQKCKMVKGKIQCQVASWQRFQLVLVSICFLYSRHFMPLFLKGECSQSKGILFQFSMRLQLADGESARFPCSCNHGAQRGSGKDDKDGHTKGAR